MSDWKETNVMERQRRRRENDKIEEEKKEGRKERAERSVHILSLHQCSSFTRPWPTLVRVELSLWRNSMPTLLFAYENGLDESQFYSLSFPPSLPLLFYIIWILTMAIIDTFIFLLLLRLLCLRWLNANEKIEDTWICRNRSFISPRSQCLNLNQLILHFDYVREYTQQAKNLNGVVCIEHPLIRRPSQVTYTHIHTHTSNACSAMLFTLNKVVLDRLMYATIEQHDCLSCRRGFSHILIEMFKIDWSSNIISFAPHLMVNKSNVAQVKCPPFFSDSHFPILNRYVYRYSWFLSLSTMCTNNSLRWTRTKEKKEREREKKMTKVQASVDLIYSNQDYKRKKNLQRWERKMSVRMKCICSSGISLNR